MTVRLYVQRVAIVALAVVLATPAFSQWRNSESTDEMTGEHSCYAISAMTSPTKKMDFPYGDVQAWLGVGSDGQSEWVFVGFNTDPNLVDTDIEDGYNVIRARIKWDDEVKTATLTQKWGAKFLHFRNGKAQIPNIQNASSVLLELNWYGEGNTYFSFSLAGSSAAIETMRASCGSK